jgi:aminomethyltransferase
VSGPRAAAACQHLTTNDVTRLVDGQVQYTLLCFEHGGVVDDVTLYRQAADRYLFCVNAGNIAKDLAWIRAHADGATVTDESAATALLALQGPHAAAILGALTDLDLTGLRFFRFAAATVAGGPAVVSRTGYTGEDGFELYVGAAHAPALWRALVDGGTPHGLQPVGLGARDTLRLVAALPLYGNDLDETTTPLAAGLGRFVALAGDDFSGRAALVRERASGSPRVLVGLELRAAGIARHGYPITAAGRVVGTVTSGTRSPTLERAIALGYVEEAAATGTDLAVEIRGRAVAAAIVPTPFYRRPRRGQGQGGI